MVMFISSEPYCSEPEPAEVEPRRPGVGRLPAEDPVELDGVPDRLVDLQRQLLGAEDQRGLARSGTAAR